ncbi:MAG: ribosome assembly factor SBDS [Candidatus Lokiarchaeota archaeon]|nr:ribosome assembly factor SBDS [Candidatus Lokiarchaeota archaeon]
MSGQIRGDKRMDFGKYIIANIRLSGRRFEILVDPDKSWELKKHIRQFQKEKEKELNKTYKVTVDDVIKISKVPMDQIVESYIIFEDIRRGEKMSEDVIADTFKTSDVSRVIAEILLNGELQLNKEQREKFISEKKKKLLDILTKNCINPQTSKPHPPQRIERALEEAKVNIDPFNPIEDQVESIVKALQPIIPIRMERQQLQISIPAEFTGKAYNLVKTLASISKEEWKPTGAVECVVEVPAGISVEFLDKLNKITHGRAMTKIIEAKKV